MDNGRFFELRKGSDLLKGQVLFSYTGIKAERASEYPIFLVFNNERIDFYFSGLIMKDAKKKGEEVDAKDNNDPYPDFIETLLFSLNLHKGKENISKLHDSLRDLFAKKFPVVGDFIIYKGSDARNLHEKHKTYAKLDQFPPVKISEGEHNFGEKLFYKTLLLDFLFDVYHSDVFDNCPGFTLIKQHLDEIPFIQAIKRKAEFYYQVENNQSGEKLVTFDSTNSNYIDKLIKAQEDWLNILQEENSYKFINRANKWFEDVETEVREALKERVIKKVTLQIKSEKQLFNQKLTASQWFVKRNNFVEAWKSAFDIYDYKKIDFIEWFGFLTTFILLAELINVVLNIKDKTFIPCDISKNSFLIISSVLFVLLLILFFWTAILKENTPLSWRLKHLVVILYRFLLIPFLILLLTSAFATSELSSFGNKEIFKGALSYSGSLYYVLGISIFLLIYLKWPERISQYLSKPNKRSLCFFYLPAFVILVLLMIYHLIAITFTISVLVFIFWVLLNDERKSHPNLDKRTSLKKVFSMLLAGLIISFFCNLLVLNYTYKDYLDKFSFVDEVWNSAFHPTENAFKGFSFDRKKVNDEEKILNILNTLKSSRVSAEKEEYYYSSLENLKITKKGKELYPIVKKINIHGFEIITLPAVLYINTFLALLLAVLIQVVLNHKNFLEGGKA